MTCHFRAKAGLAYSEQAFRPAQVSCCSHSGEREVEAILVLRAHRAQSKAIVFKAQAAAVEVESSLRAHVFQRSLREIVAHIAGDVQSLARQVAVAGEEAHL